MKTLKIFSFVFIMAFPGQMLSGHSKMPAGKPDKEYKAFSVALTNLIKAAGSAKGLDTIIGEPVKSDDEYKTWKPKIDLPGAAKSYIKDEVVVSKCYFCEFKGIKDEKVAKALYEKYLAYLEKCMVPLGFHIQKMPNDRGFPDFDDIIYRMADDSPIPIEKRPFLKMNLRFDPEIQMHYISITVFESFL